MAEPPRVDQRSFEYESYGATRLDQFSRSISLQEKALAELPEATSSNHRGKTAYHPYPMIYMQEADGATMTDVDGNTYVDFHCGVSSIITGHRPQAQIDAVKAQLDDGPYFATTFEREYEAAKLLNDIVPGSDRTKFISTGTEAVMSALRLARAYTGKEKVLTFEGMYHGHTDYALVNVHPPVSNLGTTRNPTKIPETTGIPRGTIETVESIPWNDVDLVAEKLAREGDEIAAVITEAVMSNSGLLWPDEAYLHRVRELAAEHDVLFILDEVVTGFRMGLRGAQGYFDLEPDLAIYGKALANGYPIAALTGRAEVMQFLENDPEKATFMGTFSGNPLVVAAAHANLEALEEIGEAGYQELYTRGERLTDGIRQIAADADLDVFVPRFAGFFCIHFTDGETDPTGWRHWRDLEPHVLPEKYGQFASTMIGEGCFIPPKPGRINLMHAHTDEHVDQAIEAAKTAFEDVS